MTDVTIYHNPGCGTSRNTLALIRNAGIEPTIIEYLNTPPDRPTLESLIVRMTIQPRALLREKGTPYAELGLGSDRWTDAELIDQMLAPPHPYQPTRGGDAVGRETLQAVRSGSGYPAVAAKRTICQGRRRACD